ncbi:MAG TPA: PilZ domain-containing protein [Alphaproteobacteria bacterium]|nr:PilZ domain-containing protein [Alphaproteobacteria bacterium]
MFTEAADRRKHVRYPSSLAVEVHTESDGEGFEATLADICLGGCYVCTVSPPPPGTGLVLKIRLRQSEITLAGRSVTCNPGNGMGVEFLEPGSSSGASLKELVAMVETAASEGGNRQL